MAKDTKQSRRSRRPAVYDMTSQQCIWSAAGVAPFRLCHNAFDCTTCSFDHKMQREKDSAKRSQRPTWREKGRTEGGLESRRCRHMLSGYVPVKYCSHNFECATCEYDQMVEAEVRALEAEEPLVELVGGFALAPGYYYHHGHTWSRVEYGGQIKVGLDDFAARLFGPAQSFALPELGAAVSMGEPQMALFRDGRKADLSVPVRGIVVAQNPKLRTQPELVNSSPYGAGWLMILQPANMMKDLQYLMFGRQVEEWLDEEADRLAELLDRESGYRLAATGGRVVNDIYGSVPDLDWDELEREFLFRPPTGS
jgi:glycine cleavage system H lipoate-binding protein